jgi:glycosyltransferase involved in cell wall biosynthesis
MRAVIRAPLLSVSGYGVHSRQIFSFLENSEMNFEIETQIVNWGNTPWMIDSDLENGMIGRIMSRTAGENTEPADVSIQVQLPDEWDSNLARVNIGVSAVVETDVCNPSWVESCNKMDAVIVPSDHAKRCLERSGELLVDVHVIPEWFFGEILDKRNDEFLETLDIDTSFNFLIISQLTDQSPDLDRKNLMYTIKWICEEFRDDPEVGIILKTNHGRGTHIDRTLTSNIIRKVVSEVRPGPFPKVHLIHGNLTPGEISSLYKKDSVKCLVNLTKGEGFGLPILEAAASNLPVIVTDWSAHTEFLSIGKFLKVDYDIISVPESKIDNRIFVPGAKWAMPKEESFKSRARKFRRKPAKVQEWAQDLGEKIRSEYSSASISKKYEKVVREILEKCL